jgi:hypothetical protein
MTGGQAPRPGLAPGASNGEVVAAGPGTILEARSVIKSFGQTPALRGATIILSRPEVD